jgi:hypothetical protein
MKTGTTFDELQDIAAFVANLSPMPRLDIDARGRWPSQPRCPRRPLHGGIS